MIKSFKKTTQAFAFSLLAIAFFSAKFTPISSANAEETKKTTKTATQKNKAQSKIDAKKTEPTKNSKNSKNAENSQKSSALGHKSYACADRKNLKIIGNPDLDQNLTLIYGKSNLILSRQDTETGVNRFSNSETGYDLVALPAKIMLLDTKKGMRLADDCQVKTN